MSETVRIDRTNVEQVARNAFETHGISEADAAITADMLVTSEARDKRSHGLIRLPRYIRGVKHGNVDPDGEIVIERDAGATATIDGGSRLGPAVAIEALGAATARADEHGIGVVGVHDSSHLGALGYYTDRIRRDGYICVAITNTEPAMPPYGGVEPVLGTNPIAIGLPTNPSFNLDMSTAAIARGSLEKAADRGETIPDSVAINPDGEPTTDPETALEGTILPFGGPKGSGLAIAVEVLAGGLVGAAMGTNVTGTYHTEDPCTKGDLFVVVDPAALGGSKAVDRIERFLNRLTDTETMPGRDIRLPGAESIRNERTDTLRIDKLLWERVRNLAE